MLKNKKIRDVSRKKPKLKTNLICFFMFFLFAILSLMNISTPLKKTRSAYHSSQLNILTQTENGTERIDYVDSEGRVTIAADQGFATVIITYTAHGMLEKYYDEKGEPISRYNGYYAVFREYDGKGNNIRNTYLNNEGKAVITAAGYAIEEREYNDKGQVVVSKYYDMDSNPVCTMKLGHGRIFKYDEKGNNTKTTYIDCDGSPVMTGQGYATIIRRFYSSEGSEKGKEESEFYYDENGMPVALPMGFFGLHKEYNDNGQVSALTYLDADGDPVVTSKGYTTIARTYNVDNSIATERYYDLEGKPVSLSEGQYGIRKENGQTIYLGIDGEELFNIKNFLYNNSWTVIIVTLFIIVLSGMLNRKQNVLLLIGYTAAIVYLTLLYRDPGESNAIIFLDNYRRFFTDIEARADIIKNIWLFVPLGSILYRLFQNKTVVILPAILSAVIEGIQFLSGTGFCELDDIISNSIGGLIGFYMSKQLSNTIYILSSKNVNFCQDKRIEYENN